jgi:hypothetical protein
MVNLNDLIDWAVILAVALYFGGRRRDGIIRSLEATMRRSRPVKGGGTYDFGSKPWSHISFAEGAHAQGNRR